MSPGASLRVVDLHKEYSVLNGRRAVPLRALSGLTMEVSAGEFVSVIGPSGCGKSTLLRIISGLTPGTAGEVYLGGLPLESANGRIGIAFQTPALVPWLDVKSNVMLPITLAGTGSKQYRQRLDELIKLVDLDGFQSAYPHQLSLGMQQRVALCQALISDPEILLLDEPFSGLDDITREQMGEELQRIWEVQGTTIVLVTHQVREALLLSDRVFVLTGRPAQVASELRVDLERPRKLSTVDLLELARLERCIRETLDDVAKGYRTDKGSEVGNDGYD